MARTVDEDLPDEVAFLEAHDRFSLGVQRIADMPERRVDLLRSFLAQNSGQLSKRALGGEFASLTSDEAKVIEAIFKETFGSSK